MKLKSRVEALGKHIGDTAAEIERLRADHAGSVEVLDDVRALLDYLESHPPPESVRRGLLRCLAWNPFTAGQK